MEFWMIRYGYLVDTENNKDACNKHSAQHNERQHVVYFRQNKKDIDVVIAQQIQISYGLNCMIKEQ